MWVKPSRNPRASMTRGPISRPERRPGASGSRSAMVWLLTHSCSFATRGRGRYQEMFQ